MLRAKRAAPRAIKPPHKTLSRYQLYRLAKAIESSGITGSGSVYIGMSDADRHGGRLRVIEVGPKAEVERKIREARDAFAASGHYFRWTQSEVKSLKVYGPYTAPNAPAMPGLVDCTAVCYHDYTSELWCPGRSRLQSLPPGAIITGLTLTVAARLGDVEFSTTVPMPPNATTITIGEHSARRYIREHYEPDTAAGFDADLQQAIERRRKLYSKGTKRR